MSASSRTARTTEHEIRKADSLERIAGPGGISSDSKRPDDQACMLHWHVLRVHSAMRGLRTAAFFIVALYVTSGVTSNASARNVDAGPGDYLALLKELRPGDTLRLASGTYRDGLPVHRMSGRSGAPIRIEPRDPSARPRLLARAGRSTISILDASFIEIRGLDLEGLGLPVDAVRAEWRGRFAHHITLEDLHINGYGADQQEVGISTKCPAWNWVISRNVIIGAGTGIYLGNSDGTAPFVAGLIERNLVRDTRGYNLQIKHQNARPVMPGMPTGPSATLIRNNVFSKASNAATAGLARPNVLVGHFPQSGPGASDLYLIYGNFFHENATEALFQGEGNFAFYSNVLVNSSGSAVHIQPHNGRPQSVDVFGNTILARDTGILVTGGDPEYKQRVFGNLIFAANPLPGRATVNNVTGVLQDADRWLRDPFRELGKLDLTPRDATTLTVLDRQQVPVRYIDADLDFEGRRRAPNIAGAYAADRATWRLVLERKPLRGLGRMSGPKAEDVK
jgi:hypothetical protein